MTSLLAMGVGVPSTRQLTYFNPPFLLDSGLARLAGLRIPHVIAFLCYDGRNVDAVRCHPKKEICWTTFQGGLICLILGGFEDVTSKSGGLLGQPPESLLSFAPHRYQLQVVWTRSAIHVQAFLQILEEVLMLLASGSNAPTWKRQPGSSAGGWCSFELFVSACVLLPTSDNHETSKVVVVFYFVSCLR